MSARKPDLVRRSLFGQGGVVAAHEQPDSEGETPQTRSSARAARPRRTSAQPALEHPASVESTSSTRRRAVERTAVSVPSELLMRVKDAVAVLNGWPHQYTMARFVEEAFAAQLERLKVEINGGREFPETNRKIRTGRPPGR
jgi:hypothetical protein